MDYPAGHVKKDPVTGATALKQPDGSQLGEWGIMTLGGGGHYWPTALVADWVDMVEIVNAGG